MDTISFYSYKGGTGRSLLVANVARYLAQFGQKVVVLDFDLEAPGLHYKFNLDRFKSSIQIKRGVVDYIDALVNEGKAPKSLKKYLVPIPVSSAAEGTIQLMAAGAAPSADYWRKLSGLNWHDLLYAQGAQGIPLFLELKEIIKDELKADFLLIDARTGITELGGIATAILPEKLVCLLLSNQENLEGARAVLRGIRRVPRLGKTEPPDLVPILSRIPREEEERERVITERVRNFLNEEAENLEDTLQIPELFVLHSEPELQVTECLLVGGDKSPEESVLLSDYLRFFPRMIPREIIIPHIKPLAEHARSIAFDDPEKAEKEFESLTLLGHPDAYRELLKFYRLRNASSELLMRTAERLWEMTRNSDEGLLWDAVKSSFEVLSRFSEGWVVPSQLRFVEAVWRAAGADDVKVGWELAESYDNLREHDHAAEILLSLVGNTGPHELVVARCVTQLRRAGRVAEAKSTVERFRKDLSSSPAFLTAWAKFALGEKDNEYIEALLESPLLERISGAEPIIAYRLLAAAERMEEGLELLERALHRAIQHGPSGELEEIGQFYAQMGRSSDFEKALRGSWQEEEVDNFLRRMRRSPRRSPPSAIRPRTRRR